MLFFYSRFQEYSAQSAALIFSWARSVRRPLAAYTKGCFDFRCQNCSCSAAVYTSSVIFPLSLLNLCLSFLLTVPSSIALFNAFFGSHFLHISAVFTIRCLASSLLDNLARLGICASEWTNHKWNTEYCENASRLRAFVPETSARPVGMGLPQAAWVKLNHLCTGVGRFHSSMHKWGLAPSPNCKCGASEQTTDHVLTACPIHRAPHGARGLTVLDDKTPCWLNDITASI